MKKFLVSREELCLAIEKATPNLYPGSFADSEGFTFTKHCSVCAVGGIIREIPRLNRAICKLVRERYTGLTQVNKLHCAINGIVKGNVNFSDDDSDCDSAEELIEFELERKNYLAAISIFFENILQMDDSNELKAASLQTFIAANLPATITVEV